MSNAAHPSSRLAALRGPQAVRVLEFAGALVAFYVAFSGVQILEDRGDTPRAIVRFVLATIMFAIVSWRVRDRARVESTGAPSLPQFNRSSLREPVSMARSLAGSWQALFFWAILIVGCALAIIWRFHLIDSEPYGIWFDEAQNGIVAKKILDGDRPIFISEATQLPALFFYVFAAAMGIIGDTVTALRTVTAIAGIATIGMVYLLARELFDHRVGVLAAFFLAVMRWHLNFSRFAMHGILAPLFMVAMFYFVARGLKGKGTWNFAAAGVMAALGLQGYYSFLLVPFIGGIYLGHHLLFERVLPIRQLAIGIGVLAAATAIIYAPLGIWAFQNQEQFSQRSAAVTITKDRTAEETFHVAVKSTRQHLLMFHSAGDRNGRHNIPGAPMLDTVTGFLFVLGAGYALTRANRSACVLLLAWCAISLQSGIWSVDFEAPQGYRTIAITPAIAILAALPLAVLWRIATPDPEQAAPSRGLSLSRAVSPLLGIAALGITLYLLTWTAQTNYDRYFNVQLKRFDAWAQYATDATFVAKEIQALGPENHEFRVTAVLNGAPTIRFLNPDLEAAGTAQRFDWSIDVPANTGTSTVYLLDARKKAFFEWIQGLYPGAEYKALDPPKRDGEQIAFEAVISEDLVRAYMGIDGVYTPSGGEPVRQREASLSLDWSTEPPVAPPFDAVWTGSLRIERYNYHRLALAVPGSARLFLDGELVAEGSGSLGLASYLYKGDHDLRIEARIERAGVVEMTLNGTVAEPRSFLSYPSSGHGLVGTFYRGENAEGEPALVTLDPFLGIRYHSELDSVARPFTAVWRGFLDVPASGDYRFELDAHDEGELSIDGAVVPAVPGGTLSFPLDAGRHPIEVRLRNSTGGAVIFLWWVTPGSTEREVIPTERFTPR